MEDVLPKQVSEFEGYSKKEQLWCHEFTYDQVKWADSIATEISSPSSSLPCDYFPLDPVPCWPFCCWVVSCRGTRPGESCAGKKVLAGFNIVHCMDPHLLMPGRGRGQRPVTQTHKIIIIIIKNRGSGIMGLLLLASVLDSSVCGTKASQSQVWISCINVVKSWIKSCSGRAFSLAYSKQHPLLIQSGSWNTGNKYASFYCFWGSLDNNAGRQLVFSSLSQAALPFLTLQKEILQTATYALAHIWEPSLSP